LSRLRFVWIGTGQKPSGGTAGGPEDCHAAGYDAAYSACYRAVKEKYPDVTPIAVTDQPFSRHGPSAPVDLYGEHDRLQTIFAPTFSLKCAELSLG